MHVFKVVALYALEDPIEITARFAQGHQPAKLLQQPGLVCPILPLDML